MYNNLIGINCIVHEDASEIIVNDSTKRINIQIFKVDGILPPATWFEYYSYKIGHDDKKDIMHMFPFVLDKKLQHVGCFQKNTIDTVNRFGEVTLLYYYGTLTYDGTKMFGVFEYFIDSCKTLFHRFFRPYAQLSQRAREMVLDSLTPKQIKRIGITSIKAHG